MVKKNSLSVIVWEFLAMEGWPEVVYGGLVTFWGADVGLLMLGSVH